MELTFAFPSSNVTDGSGKNSIVCVVFLSENYAVPYISIFQLVLLQIPLNWTQIGKSRRYTNTFFFWHYPLNWCGFWYWKCVLSSCRTWSFVKWRSVVWYTVIKTYKERAPAILLFRIRKVFGRREHQFVFKKFHCRILQHNFSRSRITERGRRFSLQ